MPELKTRKPTGAVPWPFILIEGPEKSGKSWSIAELSTSDRVGTVYWLDLGEGSADEYGAIPGADYEVIVHDGSWWDIVGQIDAVSEVAQKAVDAGEPPVVLAIDSGSAMWELLKGWADERARERMRRKNKKPGEDVTISMDLWNAAGARHANVITKLHKFPGIVVVTARGKEVAALDDNGKPMEGQKTYKVEGQKNLAFDATVWVRYSRETSPRIIGARSVHYGVRPGVDEPKPTTKSFTLEKLIFDVLKCDPAKAHVRDIQQLSGGELAEHERVDVPVQDQPSAPPRQRAASTKATPNKPAAGSFTANQAELAKKGAMALLNATERGNAARAADYVPHAGVENVDVTEFLTQDDLDTLGIEAPVKLGDLAEKVLAYWDRHGHGPRMQPDAAKAEGDDPADGQGELPVAS